jgi:hypothetical protein
MLPAPAASRQPNRPGLFARSYALRDAAMLHGGPPALLDEVQRWRSDDLWYWSLQALADYVRAAADRIAEPVESVCRRIAQERGITLTGEVAP